MQTKSNSEIVILIMFRFAYNEKKFANLIDMPERTLSRRLKLNDFRFDEIREINKIISSKFKLEGIKLKFYK